MSAPAPILIADPKAQAFISELIDLCHRHRMHLGGVAWYSLELTPLGEGESLKAVDGATFAPPPEGLVSFDLERTRGR